MCEFISRACNRYHSIANLHAACWHDTSGEDLVIWCLDDSWIAVSFCFFHQQLRNVLRTETDGRPDEVTQFDKNCLTFCLTTCIDYDFLLALTGFLTNIILPPAHIVYHGISIIKFIAKSQPHTEPTIR